MKRGMYLLAALFMVLGLALAMTPAGTAITNQASASYIDSAGQSRTTTSNLVTTIVQQVYAFTITPNGSETNPGQIRSNLPGGQVLFQYVVTNNGNGTDTINLSTAQGTGDNFDLQNVRIYLDANCNGNVDAGEAQVTNVTLAMGAQACVIVAATIPTTAQNGQYGNLNLTGSSVGSNNTLTDTDNWARATASTAAALTAFKSASPSGNVAPGATVTYTISGANTGGSAAYGVSVTVDNQTKTGILVEDTIPSGLTVSQMPTGSAGAGTVRYVYYNGTSWVTLTSSLLPITGDGTKKIGMLIEGTGAFFPQGAQYSLSFTAQVPQNAQAGTGYANSAVVRFNDGTQNRDVTTNTTNNTVGASYDVKVGPYGYPEGSATGTYTVGAYTITRSGDAQSVAQVYSGTNVIFRHTLKNTGNTQDSFTLSLTGAPSGWACQLVADDLTTPINGPVGPAAAGGTYDFALKCAIPANYTGGPVNLTVTATSVGDSSKKDTTTDEVTSILSGYAVDLAARGYSGDGNANNDNPASQSANPGQTVYFPLEVYNAGANPDVYNLTATVPQGWSVVFYPDANCDGVPDGAPIANTNLLNPGQKQCVVAAVTVPAQTAPGNNPVSFTATSTTVSGVSDTVSSQVAVNLVAQVTLDPDRSGTVTSPGTIVYTHTLLNNSNAPAYCDISGNGGAHGWTYQYSTDGTSWYASLADVYVAPNGRTATLYVRVTVPAGEPVGRVDVNTVRANCDVTTGTPDNTYEATDTATETTTVVGGELRLTKSVDKTSAFPGDTLTYTIVAENIGTGNLTKVIVSDPIPAYTSFVSVSATATGFSGTYTILYSTDGSTWSPTAPTSAPTGGSVYVAVDTNGDNSITDQDIMPPGARITITLTVQVQ
ncbi:MULTISPECIES: DUF11 domain-containing protein [Thermus]|uniref:NPCBM-associated, NEW3 domain of alpha-galactosidase n=1 Tax=Thermus brockianus TaxID=56956 RepID=A0A1J0LW24_THEBO|nr:DUF11 domain-containing protein [Thermus brockianus]APD10558.1 NPCBM-associated, NEW3 domain of alpha-galactosidase [Thermus brockianus]